MWTCSLIGYWFEHAQYVISLLDVEEVRRVFRELLLCYTCLLMVSTRLYNIERDIDVVRM